MNASIKGQLTFPAHWTVFAPVDFKAPPLPADQMHRIPERITLGGHAIDARTVQTTRHQLDLRPFFGDPPYDVSQTAYVFVPLQSETDQAVTLGFGADYYLEARLNGKVILDTTQDGNGGHYPPSIDDFRVTVPLIKGENVLAVRLLSGIGGALLAMGGPTELRRGDFTSILPPPRKLDAAALAEALPPDPAAPVRWSAPEGFDPTLPGLGLPPLEAAEHAELLHGRLSQAPLDEGGTGIYESLQHGAWNHNNGIFRFRDRLLAIWDNHAMDENGPGSRRVARVGKIVDAEGHIDWGDTSSLIEMAPQAVPVRRRKLISDRDAIRGAQATGAFRQVGERLFFFGRLKALHGVCSIPGKEGKRPGPGEMLPDEHFFFGKGPDAPRAGFIHWDLGFRFFQEWGLVDDRLQPVAPLYRENDLPPEKALTPHLTLPLEPLLPPYRDAPLLSAAPADVQACIRRGLQEAQIERNGFRPGQAHVAHDGQNGLVLAHSAEFQRPDGAWVIVIENQYPGEKTFYYAAEKPDADAFYPPPRRTSLYGAVSPAAGVLPDGRIYFVGNSPNRRTMFLTLSRDGRCFDRTWLLMHKTLKSKTPGIMKGEGGPGSGPQYFRTALCGNSLWLVYSISKEHVGATRVPLESLTDR